MPGNLLLEGMRTGQGVIATTRAFIEQDVARGDAVILFEDDERGFGYFLLHRPEPPRAAVKAFNTWLRREIKNAQV